MYAHNVVALLCGQGSLQRNLGERKWHVAVTALAAGLFWGLTKGNGCRTFDVFPALLNQACFDLWLF